MMNTVLVKLIETSCVIQLNTSDERGVNQIHTDVYAMNQFDMKMVIEIILAVFQYADNSTIAVTYVFF